MSKKPTIRDLARMAGVSVATISMALRNHPRVSRKTCRTVQELAAQAGYAPDPEVARLMNHLRINREEKDRQVLALVIRMSDKEMKSYPTLNRTLAGAQNRAEQLGYRLDDFPLDPRISDRQLGRILLNRGIRGILLAPQRNPQGRLTLPWEHFACVTIGFTHAHPDVHHIANDQIHEVHLAMKALQNLGYQRPALVVEKYKDDRLRNHWTAGFLSSQLRHVPQKNHVPPMLEPQNGKRLIAWFSRWKPDVIIGADLSVPLSHLAQAGYHPPGDFAFAVLDKQPDGPWAHHAGVDQRSANVGKTAVDILTGCLLRNEIGLPSPAQTVFLPGVWVDGETAPPKHPKRKRAARKS